jgi:protease-4
MALPTRSLPVLAALLLYAPHVGAQFHRASDPVASPASSVVLRDDALAVDLDPAALARLSGLSVALLHSEINAADSWLARGDALYLATPVWGPLALGVTLQSIRPGDVSLRPPGSGRGNRGMGALAVALSPTPAMSFGVTARAFTSGDARFDGLTGFDASLLLRPSRWLSLGLTGRDLFVSRSGFGTAGLELGPSLLFSVGLRPFQNDALTVSGELVTRLRDPLRVGVRGGLALALPYIGTVAGMVEAEDVGNDEEAVRVMAELAVHVGQVTLAGGVAAGEGFGSAPGWYAFARAERVPRAGVPAASKVLAIEIPELSARGMIVLALALERARTDPRIGGVLLRPRGASMGMAYAQEVRVQIASLRTAGKKVACHLDSASGSDYYACAGADRILIDPAGDLRLMGVSTSTVVFGETLRKLGIRADFIRIGPYKSAPEQLTQQQLSDAAREQMNTLLDDAHHRLLSDLSADLQVPQQRVGELVDSGPYLAHAAHGARLVHRVGDEYDLDDSALDLFGGRSMTRELPAGTERPWGKSPAVGVVVIDDEIVDGESVEVPFVGMHMTGADTIVRELEEQGRDPSIRAVVLRVDSPGGAALGSDKIWRAVRRLRERKPVVASMGAMAASGGYYVAAAADEIWADPSTLTGSIGIFYGKVDVAQLAEKIGVHIETFQRGRRAGADSIYRPFTEEERAALAEMLRGYYRLFLSRVAEGRKMSPEAIDAVARGRVHSGDAAQRLGLVDRLGGLASALIRARQLANLGAGSAVVVRPQRKNSLLDYVIGGGASAESSTDDLRTDAAAESALPTELRALMRAAGVLHRLRGQPLALLPFDARL